MAEKKKAKGLRGEAIDIIPATALVHGSGVERQPIFEEHDYFVASLRRTDFGRAHASIRLRVVQPMATSVCCAGTSAPAAGVRSSTYNDRSRSRPAIVRRSR